LEGVVDRKEKLLNLSIEERKEKEIKLKKDDV